MGHLKFMHGAVAGVALPEALRPALAERLRTLAPPWRPWDAAHPAPLVLTLLLDFHENCPRAKIAGWALLGEWDPGHLAALRFRYGADGDQAVIVWSGDLGDGHGARVVVVAEVEVGRADGRFLVP